VQRLLHIARTRSGYEPERARTAHEEHLAVLDAIADHDAGRAGAVMRHHLRMGFENVAQIYRLGDQVPGDGGSASA
jgi:DNA-binding GntR family transcriptional regulator